METARRVEDLRRSPQFDRVPSASGLICKLVEEALAAREGAPTAVGAAGEQSVTIESKGSRR